VHKVKRETSEPRAVTGGPKSPAGRWIMERGNSQGCAASLEHTLENTHLDLGEAMDQFRELCPLITPERNVPTEIITDIRQTYRRIQDQLTKIKGVKQLLEGKYRQYYHRDSQREREIIEVAFLAKSLYSKFEYTLQEIETKRKLRDRREGLGAYRQHIPIQWFQSKGNQVMLLKNLWSLGDLAYKTQRDLECEQRREIIRNGTRSISLFVLSGETDLIDQLQSRIRLREYDIKERSSEDECRGALTHLKEVSLLDVERVMRRFIDSSDVSKLKCLLLRIQSQEDLEKEIIGSTESILRVMGKGELRALAI